MRFEYRLLQTLPRLAWSARIRASDPVVQVLHGPWVETSATGFVEGAWDGPFAAYDFDQSAVLAGSGGKLMPMGVRFATPANMYERLHSARAGDTLLVSNSLAFLLALSGDQLDPHHRHYYLDLLDHFRSGIHVKTKRLRLARTRWVELHDCCQVDVAPDLATTRVEKPWGDPPASYADYAALLEHTLRRVIENAGDPRRQRRYRPLAMVSQGYDTTAVAALASRLGCREAVTFLKSVSVSISKYADDSGEAVGRSLGYAVTSYERNDHLSMPTFREEEFYFEPWGVDRTMTTMEGQLEGSLLLSGRAGEWVWTRGGARHWGLPDLQQPIDFTPGCALGEFRMRTGFLHFPPATIAAVHAPVIAAWNASPELAPWSVGGDYDKPIARRIAEEAGVPRGLFGQVKKGGLRLPGTKPRSGLRWWLQQRTRSPRQRAFVLRTIGHRLHPRWRLGSLEIQAHAARMVERYRRAVAEG